MKIKEAVEELNEFMNVNGKESFDKDFGKFKILLSKLASEADITAGNLFIEWINSRYA